MSPSVHDVMLPSARLFTKIRLVHATGRATEHSTMLPFRRSRKGLQRGARVAARQLPLACRPQAPASCAPHACSAAAYSAQLIRLTSPAGCRSPCSISKSTSSEPDLRGATRCESRKVTAHKVTARTTPADTAPVEGG